MAAACLRQGLRPLRALCGQTVRGAAETCGAPRGLRRLHGARPGALCSPLCAGVPPREVPQRTQEPPQRALSSAALGLLRALPHGAPTCADPARLDVKSLATQRVKDPERPKRPATAFLRFLVDFRRTKPPDMTSNKEVVKAAGDKWKQMSPTLKKPFEDAYEADRAVYKTKYDEYVSSGKKEGWARDPEKPKKPLTGFLRFVQEKRQASKETGLKVAEFTKIASRDWKALSEAQQKPYVDAHLQEKAQYQAAMKAYKDSGKEEQWKSRVGIKTNAEKAEEKKAALEKKKAARQAAAEKKKALADRKKAAAQKKKEVAAAKKKEKAEKKKEKEKALKAKRAEALAKKKELLKAKKEALKAKKSS